MFSLQGQTLPSYRLRHYNVKDHLGDLLKHAPFTNAAVIQPVSSSEDIFRLHALRSRQGAERTRNEVKRLEKTVRSLTPQLPDDFKRQSWPTGHRPGNRPVTRWDVLRHSYFNLTHRFFSDDYTNVRKLTASEAADVENVLRSVVATAETDALAYRRLVNGYSLFDLSRGLDYVLDVGFRDLKTGKEVVKRFEVCKPLGQTEILPMPYVTENSRVNVVIVVTEHEVPQARGFLEQWSKLQNQRILVMLVLLYRPGVPSKGDGDPFLSVKNLAVTKRTDGGRAAWLSIRLAGSEAVDRAAMQIASVDLALRKIGPESLVLILDVFAEFSPDFLNRVRMNTIAGVQAFSPIPFRRFHPTVTGAAPSIHKTSGRFDAEEYGYASFYGKDWIAARLQGERELVIVRSERDVPQLLSRAAAWDVFKVFVRFSTRVHCMRAPDPGLAVKYHGHSLSWLGSKTQLANLILSYSQSIVP